MENKLRLIFDEEGTDRSKLEEKINFIKELPIRATHQSRLDYLKVFVEEEVNIYPFPAEGVNYQDLEKISELEFSGIYSVDVNKDALSITRRNKENKLETYNFYYSPSQENL